MALVNAKADWHYTNKWEGVALENLSTHWHMMVTRVQHAAYQNHSGRQKDYRIWLKKNDCNIDKNIISVKKLIVAMEAMGCKFYDINDKNGFMSWVSQKDQYFISFTHFLEQFKESMSHVRTRMVRRAFHCSGGSDTEKGEWHTLSKAVTAAREANRNPDGSMNSRTCADLDVQLVAELQEKIIEEASLATDNVLSWSRFHELATDISNDDRLVYDRHFLPVFAAVFGLSYIGEDEFILSMKTMIKSIAKKLNISDKQIGRKELVAVFRKHDTNKDKKLDASEFQTFIEKLDVYLDELESVGLFAMFDFDHDGSITCAELVGAITAATEELRYKAPRPRPGMEIHMQRHNSLSGRWIHKAISYAHAEKMNESYGEDSTTSKPRRKHQRSISRKITRTMSRAIPLKNSVRALTRSFTRKKNKKKSNKGEGKSKKGEKKKKSKQK